MKIAVTELWHIQFFNDFQRGITRKLRKGNNHYCVGHLVFSIYYHEDILKIVYEWTDGQCYAIIRPVIFENRRIKTKLV